MEMIVGALDYNKLGRQALDKLKDNLRDKKGVEETMDCEIGPDVRYVLSRNDINLAKRYLMGPITPAEYRELTFKLRELQMQEVGHMKKNKAWNCSEKISDKEKLKDAIATARYNDFIESHVDLVT